MLRLIMEENDLNRICHINLKNKISVPQLETQTAIILPPLAKKQKNSKNENIYRSSINQNRPLSQSSKKNGLPKKCSECKAKGKYQADNDKHRLYSKKCPFHKSNVECAEKR